MTPPYPKGHVISARCQWPLDEIIVHVCELYHHSNFNYCTFYVSVAGIQTIQLLDAPGRPFRPGAWKFWQNPITRCPWQTFQAGGMKFWQSTKGLATRNTLDLCSTKSLPILLQKLLTRFLVHLSRRLKCTIVIKRCLSVRPSVINFSHFRLLLLNRWTEFNETWQEARTQHPLPSLCFSGRSEKQDGRPGLWLAETFSTSPLKPLNGIQRNLTGSKISTSSTKFVLFGSIGKTRWPPWPLIGRDIFDFSSETTERKSTKLDRKQDLNILYQVCFSSWSEKQDGRHGLWLAETFSTSPL